MPGEEFFFGAELGRSGEVGWVSDLHAIFEGNQLVVADPLADGSYFEVAVLEFPDAPEQRLDNSFEHFWPWGEYPRND